MIKFFRHIRQNLLNQGKTSKYFKYAIGEIILVVIGILIALSINNWNEQRKEIIKERAINYSLLLDLKADSISYGTNYNTLKNIGSLHSKLYRFGVKNDSTVMIEYPNYIRRLPYYNPITKENNPYITSKISNELIRKEVLIYFRNIKDMDDTYGEFSNVVKNRIRIYLGTKEAYNLSNWFENASKIVEKGTVTSDLISKDDLLTISKLAAFQQLLFEASVKLADCMMSLEILIKQNEKLIKVIEKELDEKQ